MGAWGSGNFENDDAMDWLAELEEAENTAFLDQTLDDLLDGGEELEAPDACTGLAVAEVVASMLGNPTEEVPEEVARWIPGKTPPSPALIKKADKIVRLILKHSELRELWEEAESLDEWQEAVEDLLARLKP